MFLAVSPQCFSGTPRVFLPIPPENVHGSPTVFLPVPPQCFLILLECSSQFLQRMFMVLLQCSSQFPQSVLLVFLECSSQFSSELEFSSGSSGVFLLVRPESSPVILQCSSQLPELSSSFPRMPPSYRSFYMHCSLPHFLKCSYGSPRVLPCFT